MTGAHDGLKPSAMACRSSCPVQPVAKASRAQGVDSPATQQALQDAMMGGQGSLPAGHPVRVREAVEKAAAARTEEPAPQVQMHCILHPGTGGPPSRPLPAGLSCLSARHQLEFGMFWKRLRQKAHHMEDGYLQIWPAPGSPLLNVEGMLRQGCSIRPALHWR